MSRPRGSSDEWLLKCAEQAVVSDGPARWTLAGAAERAGVSAATYVHRFGSKDEVVQALSRRWIASISPAMAAATASIPPGRKQVLAGTLCGFAELDDPERAGAQLTALAGDLADPELRSLLAHGWSVVQTELATLVSTAHEVGDLARGPSAVQAARLLAALANGLSLDWSLSPEGRLVDRLTEDVNTVLDSWTDHQEEEAH